MLSNLDDERFNVPEIMKQFDKNGDGLIDEQEFLARLKEICEMLKQECLKKQELAGLAELDAEEKKDLGIAVDASGSASKSAHDEKQDPSLEEGAKGAK